MLPIFRIEDQIISIIQANSNVFLDCFFKAITFLGHPALWLFIAALLYWTNRERESFFLVNTIVFAAALAATLKVFFARSRPSALAHRVFPQDSLSARLEANAPDFGLPSGHATTVAAALSFFSKGKKAKTIIAFVLIAILVAFSRLYLGAHFPLDVIAGLALGAFVGIATRGIDNAFKRHNFHLSKMKDEAIVIVMIAAGIIAIFFLDVPVLALSVLGYYAGFFFSKEVGFKQSEFEGKKRLLKLCSGTVSVAIMTALTIFLFRFNEPLALACFFGNGFWISFGFPEMFEKILKIALRFPAIERLLE